MILDIPLAISSKESPNALAVAAPTKILDMLCFPKSFVVHFISHILLSTKVKFEPLSVTSISLAYMSTLPGSSNPQVIFLI